MIQRIILVGVTLLVSLAALVGLLVVGDMVTTEEAIDWIFRLTFGVGLFIAAGVLIVMLNGLKVEPPKK
jgi:hypothetical protein